MVDAKKCMIEVFEKGLYQERKRKEKNLDLLKKQMKRMVEAEYPDERRLERNGVVVKYVTKKTFKTDKEGLMYFLYEMGEDIGMHLLLPYCCNIVQPKKEDSELIECLKPFEEETGYRAEFFPKRNLPDCEADVQFTNNLDELAQILRVEDQIHDVLDREIKRIQRNMLKDEQFSKNIQTPYGSISKIKKKPSYDAVRIFNECGPEFFMKIANPTMENIQYFIMRGFIKPSEIAPYRKLISIGGDYVVMTHEKEQTAFQLMDAKKLQAYADRFGPVTIAV